ncbi:uncharacterized protein ACHE_80638A [Aspergillus chevalieri]|uniref:Cytochrome P450 n=1 Tax=Aspergillus chevalieri TaxID=182096 RepID=A0A7R7VYP6_ASPCH|nr:uncharacterized protein ACHE_80638A [Aspergillus chevalieri]BCR92738.1 hypothetical protein ACHE_80638A [Aspergillus chevalieri]
MARTVFRTPKAPLQKHFDMCSAVKPNYFDWAPSTSFFRASNSATNSRSWTNSSSPTSPTPSPSPPPNSTRNSPQKGPSSSLARFTRDSRVLRDQLVAVLLAGCDTTAGTLSFTLFELGGNPHIVHRLREEIGSRLGLGTNARNPPIQI